MPTYYVHAKPIKPIKREGVRKNRVITVYQKFNKSFGYVGHEVVDHNGYRGDEAIANKILHEKFGYKWNPRDNHYTLGRQDIKLISLPTGVAEDTL